MKDGPDTRGSAADSARAAADYLADMLESMAVVAHGASLHNSAALFQAARRMVRQEQLYLTGRTAEPDDVS
jgi:hypothetical protein